MNGVAVPDSSAVVAASLDDGPDGLWARDTLRLVELAAPELSWFEAANVLRRAGREIEPGQIAQAHVDLLSLAIEPWPYAAIAQRCWELRNNLTIYDASYVALAEVCDGPRVTLDRRMSRATGIGCRILTPPT